MTELENPHFVDPNEVPAPGGHELLGKSPGEGLPGMLHRGDPANT